MNATTSTVAPETIWALSEPLPPTTRSSTRMPMLWNAATNSNGTRTTRVRASCPAQTAENAPNHEGVRACGRDVDSTRGTAGARVLMRARGRGRRHRG